MIEKIKLDLERPAYNRDITITAWQYHNIVDKINEIIDHLPQEKEPTCVDLNYNCTLAEIAKQVGIKLWQAMVMMKYAELKPTKEPPQDISEVYPDCSKIIKRPTKEPQEKKNLKVYCDCIFQPCSIHTDPAKDEPCPKCGLYTCLCPTKEVPGTVGI